MSPGIGIGLAPNEILQTIGGAALEYYQKVLAIQPGNLIRYWPFWDAAGPNAEELIVGDDGGYVGVTLGQPGIGDGRTSPRFDGVGDVVHIDSVPWRAAFNGSEGTFASWCRVFNAGVWTDGSNRTVVRIIEGTFNNFLILRKTAVNNELEFNHRGTGVITQILHITAAPIDWVHIALTWSVLADELKAYIDGAQVGVTMAGVTPWNLQPDINNSNIGASTLGGATSWNGWLAHPAFWTTPLTQPEIASLATV